MGALLLILVIGICIHYVNKTNDTIEKLKKENENLSVYTIGERDIYLAGDIDTNSVAEVNAKMIAALKNIKNATHFFIFVSILNYGAVVF